MGQVVATASQAGAGRWARRGSGGEVEGGGEQRGVGQDHSGPQGGPGGGAN